MYSLPLDLVFDHQDPSAEGPITQCRISRCLILGRILNVSYECQCGPETEALRHGFKDLVYFLEVDHSEFVHRTHHAGQLQFLLHYYPLQTFRDELAIK